METEMQWTWILPQHLQAIPKTTRKLRPMRVSGTTIVTNASQRTLAWVRRAFMMTAETLMPVGSKARCSERNEMAR